jgi:hypothetical protein
MNTAFKPTKAWAILHDGGDVETRSWWNKKDATIANERAGANGCFGVVLKLPQKSGVFKSWAIVHDNGLIEANSIWTKKKAAAACEAAGANSILEVELIRSRLQGDKHIHSSRKKTSKSGQKLIEEASRFADSQKALGEIKTEEEWLCAKRSFIIGGMKTV